MSKSKFTIGSFAVILDSKKQVLLCHRCDYDLWNLPGGAVETGESPWQAVIRETKEETGLNVKIKKLVGIYAKPKQDDLVFSFLCQVVSGKITLNDEADQIKYFSIEELPRNTVPKQVSRVKDALQDKKNIILKCQYGKSGKALLKELNL